MKKSILNLGKALNRAEQKLINGGNGGAEGCDSWYEEHLCRTMGICPGDCGPFYIV